METSKGISFGLSGVRAIIAAIVVLAGIVLYAGPASAATVPGVPTGVVATAGYNQAAVSWTAPATGDAVVYYNIQYSSNAGSTWTTSSWRVAGTSATIINLTGNTTYIFRVKATNAGGSSAWSDPSAAAVIIPVTAPVAPATPTVTAGNASITVSWNPPSTDGGSPVTSYQVMILGLIYNFDASTTSWTFTSDPLNGGIQNGQWYHPVVAATNAFGQSNYSLQPANVFPGFAPLAPASVTAKANGLTSASVSWPFSVTSYGNGGWQVNNYTVDVYDGASFVRTITTANGGVHTLSVTGLTTGHSYTFGVTAHATNGNSGTTTSAAALIGTAPGAVSGIVATPGSHQVSLAWNAAVANGATVSYTIVAHSGASSWTTTSATNSYVWTGLTPGASYWFTITANNSFGNSAAVNSGMVKVLS